MTSPWYWLVFLRDINFLEDRERSKPECLLGQRHFWSTIWRIWIMISRTLHFLYQRFSKQDDYG